MSSIIRDGDTFHGISVFGRGVFTDDKWGGRTYAGQCKDGHACGLGVATWSFNGSKDYATLYAGGYCSYYGEACARDDPRLLALIAQVAPVEVRPAAPDRHPPLRSQSSDGSACSFCRPQALAKATATEVIPTPHASPGGRATQPNDPQCTARARSDA